MSFLIASNWKGKRVNLFNFRLLLLNKDNLPQKKCQKRLTNGEGGVHVVYTVKERNFCQLLFNMDNLRQDGLAKWGKKDYTRFRHEETIKKQNKNA